MERKQNSGFSKRNQDFLSLSIESRNCQLTLFKEYLYGLSRNFFWCLSVLKFFSFFTKDSANSRVFSILNHQFCWDWLIRSTYVYFFITSTSYLGLSLFCIWLVDQLNSELTWYRVRNTYRRTSALKVSLKNTPQKKITFYTLFLFFRRRGLVQVPEPGNFFPCGPNTYGGKWSFSMLCSTL